MNKIAIISDIHSNYSALTAVLDNIKKKNVEKIICLGDIVTRCANPDLVIDVLRKEADIIIKGNCDDIVYKNTKYTI